ncbi:alpha-hydroxy acid oxidase [Sandaracinobacteroides saxicola]|uniref:Alpha-hydroxy-acid oxidizing protein n=1 Tax=Sandaracinobacteroides saxicola TaxID=2759707 RepID=A0A7G5IMT5_9SPHN|nr:alpha-hydroxy acid oxidase [Sandaracinobacteroides saxicola]QMW24677.1 alpha-hydroxy-acid oxidizing protein [Sandaracinobacteroides saxicola]
MSLADCHNVGDFRELARRRLPFPVFHYIDGAADDEVTRRRNTQAYDDVDLVPDVLAGTTEVDLSVEVLGRRIAMPLFASPTALQRLFHWRGERAVAAAAARYGTFFGISSLATVGLEEIGAASDGPKLFQFYYHRDKGLNAALIERAKAARFDALALTVDTIVSGNRERCKRTGFTSPPKLTPASAVSFALHPRWTLNYLFRERFALPNLESHLVEGSKTSVSVQDYFNTMLDPTMSWADAEAIRAAWGGPFCLKGVMSVADARRAVEIGASAIMVSNHGGRQLDGARAPFDQLAEIVDAVGDRVEVICDGGVTRGTHVLKALSVGARAVSGGRLYLYALAAGGQAGVERALGTLRDEIERGMRLLGKARVSELSRGNLRRRQGGASR